MTNVTVINPDASLDLYEFSRSEVRCLKLVKRKWMFGRWFAIELVDGTTPDIQFGGTETLIKAFEDRGWLVEVE